MSPQGDKNAVEALHTAVFTSNLTVVRLLLQRHPQLPTHPEACQRPWLNNALQDGELEMACLLLDAGADPNLRSIDGAIPLGLTIEPVESLGLAQLLLERGANPNAKSSLQKNASSLLHMAVHARCADQFIRLFLAYGADPNVCDSNGTPIARAARFAKHDAVMALLAGGADPFLKVPRRFWETPRMLNAFEEAAKPGRESLLADMQAWLQAGKAAQIIGGAPDDAHGLRPL